ncbi:hypothetical protein C1H46_005915 [Malus baccata]|uniref:Protein kinase domain-containing protein n=1 Tax=Malus baccata TaxID=106549 RepID=A0A540ND65_MALBA|nr:hypothetical protein C1H46_005915 [Malus baccata]
MEQFRHIGEVLGSMKALMMLRDEILINQCQCCLLHDVFTLAFDTIGEEIQLNLKLEEKKTKWKALEQPLRELHRVFKEGELYIRHCMDVKNWWGKTILLHQNKDCVEFHIHNLFCHYAAVIEAIENAGEIAGLNQEEMHKKRVLLTRKYDREWNDPKLFQWRFGKQYLVPKLICNRLESAWREDRWRLVEALKVKKISGSFGSTRNEQQLGDLLLKKLSGSETLNGKLFPSSILLGSADYHVRRRLGGGTQYKEIQWLGQNFAMRHFFGDIEPLNSEISTLLTLSHPNVLQYLSGFYDEEKKECFLVMELMNKDLRCYMKENCGARRQVLFSLPVVVDIMLQIARGMEYLHSRKIYHGELNPLNVFLKARSCTEGYFHVKVSGFGLSCVRKPTYRKSQQQNEINPLIWCAPEVLAEQEQPGNKGRSKYTEKADVYSFAMLCFELLTGKVPFEDSHLQGDKMSNTIRAGGRPLFPYPSPKYLVNLTKRCWHSDPSQRLGFSSICRVLRYIKKFLTLNPDDDQPILQSPPTDYCEIESWFLKNSSAAGYADLSSVSQLPFQMFSYRLGEKEKTSPGIMRIRSLDSISDTTSANFKQESPNGNVDTMSIAEDPFVPLSETRSVCFDVRSSYDLRSVCSEAPMKRTLTAKKRQEAMARKASGYTRTSKTPTTPRLSTPRLPSPRFPSPKLPPPKLASPKHPPAKLSVPAKPCLRGMKTNQSPPQPSPMSTKGSASGSRHRTGGHVSDSEIH